MQDLPITPKQMAELLSLAKTQEGRKIMKLLQQQIGPELKNALDQKDYNHAKNLVEEFIKDPQVKSLLAKLGRS